MSSQTLPLTRIEIVRPMWTLVLASIAAFMACIDTMVVTTALPVLRTSLHGSLADLEWTVNGYNLAFACLLLTGAALGDRFGRRRMFCLGLGGFTAASAAAALSTSVATLIEARAAQGACAALVLPLTLTLITDAFPEQRRGAAIGVWAGVMGFGGVLGPIIGGAVVQGLSWQWIFWVNVPIGVLVVPLATVRLRESFGPKARMDLPGLVLAAAALLAITWSLVRSSSMAWGSREVLGGLLAGAALLAAFIRREKRTTQPMLPLRLFARRGFVAANGVALCIFASLWGAVFLMAQYFQAAQHLSPLAAGLRLVCWTAPSMLVAPVAGKLASRYGNRPFMASGLILHALGLVWIAAIATPHTSIAQLAGPPALSGIGIALVMPTVSNHALASVPDELIGIASGANSAIRELGGVLGVALLSAAFTRPHTYTSPDAFVVGFSTALYLAAALALAGVLFTTIKTTVIRSQQAPATSPASATAAA